MKAHPSIRDTYWICAGWYFYVDLSGDVHTSYEDPWSDASLNSPGRLPHNHWLTSEGRSIGTGGRMLSQSLENK